VSVTGVTVKPIDKERVVNTVLHTNRTLGAAEVKAELLVWSMGGRKNRFCDQRTKTTTAALFGDQPSVQTESAEACNKSNMTMGPVAHQNGRIIIVGGRSIDCSAALCLQKVLQMLVHFFDEAVCFSIRNCPAASGIETCLVVFFLQCVFKGNEKSDYCPGGWKKFPRQRVTGSDHFLELGE
jgi:hypothetical protein